MREILVQCEYGRRTRDGRLVRPASCQNRASGLFRVTRKRGKSKLMYLCAQCAFDKMPNHVACIMPSEDGPPDAVPIYVRDVRSVELIKSFTTTSVVVAGVGSKHWVEPNKPSNGE